MKFDQEKQRGTKRKELGPITSCSIPPDASYQDVLAKGIEEFFPSSGQRQFNYYLADAQGGKLPDDISGTPWTLGEYLHGHGYFPSKTKLYCVQVSYAVYI